MKKFNTGREGRHRRIGKRELSGKDEEYKARQKIKFGKLECAIGAVFLGISGAVVVSSFDYSGNSDRKKFEIKERDEISSSEGIYTIKKVEEKNIGKSGEKPARRDYVKKENSKGEKSDSEKYDEFIQRMRKEVERKREEGKVSKRNSEVIKRLDELLYEGLTEKEAERMRNIQKRIMENPEEELKRWKYLKESGSWVRTTERAVASIEGVLKYEGEIVNGVPDGKGELTFTNGTSYKGYFKEGLPNGEGIETYSDGRKYEGHFVNGKKEGIGILRYPDGKRGIVEFKNDMLDGRGLFFFPNGKNYVARFKENKVIALKEGVTEEELKEAMERYSEEVKKDLVERWGANMGIGETYEEIKEKLKKRAMER